MSIEYNPKVFERTGFLFNLDFGGAEIAETSRGKREVYYADANQIFWLAWRREKMTVQAAGFRVFKSDESEGGDWRVAFWPHLSDKGDNLKAATAVSNYLVDEAEREAHRLADLLASEDAPAELKPDWASKNGPALKVIEGGDNG